ncbi:carbohydrate ABC transporter permease [Streptomyces sp. NPDC088847]|uniref:carbohydrate ABC transporter permease n=1 Tax=Streptomyces sp. NPDC088847 TaxID=3365909 RepID=UPI00382B10B3
MSTLTPPRAPAPGPKARRRHPAYRGHATAAWLLIAPALIGFLVFAVYPTVRGTYFSFTTYHILSPAQWTGLANFRQMMDDSVFWHSLRATLYFVVLSVGIGILVSLVTAVVLHRLTRSTVIRGLVILPFLISGVVTAVIWSWMLDPQLGIVNVAIKAVTGERVEFLGSSSLAIPSVALISVWKSMGYNAVLIFAGLQTIPGEIYEAARLDGASEVRMFRHITVPLLRPILAMVVILSIISSIQVFDIVQVATKGGPANASNVLQMYIYDTAFSQYNFGYASAMSLALFAMLTVITFVQLRVTRANESDTN